MIGTAEGGRSGRRNESKDRQTKWFVEVNDWRNIVSHASSGKTVSIEDLSKLQDYERWVDGRIRGSDVAGETTDNAPPD